MCCDDHPTPVPLKVSWAEVRGRFSGDQLRVARELRRLTQAALAREAAALSGSALSSAAVSQYELGLAVPSAATLEALAGALRVGPEFLTEDAADLDVELPAYFRSLRSTSAQQRRWSRHMVQLVHRLAQVLHEHVELPERNIPRVPADPYQPELDRRAAAEAAAEKVRRLWKLPRGPVSDVVGTLESHGVVCLRLAIDDSRIDAFSVNFDDHPVAVLGTDKDKWDRSRFDAAHELGHLVMHEEAAGVPEAERQANEFAAAFLMPAADIRRSLPNRADWALLMDLKRQWGVSIGALLMRAKTLAVMSDAAYLSATKVMSARGWRRHEPVDGAPESPSLLADAIKRAKRRGVDIAELRSQTAIPDDLFDELCGLVSP